MAFTKKTLKKIRKQNLQRRTKTWAYTTRRELSVLLVEALLQGGPIYISRAWYQLSHTTVCSLLSTAGSSSCLMKWTHIHTNTHTKAQRRSLRFQVFITGSNCHGRILMPVQMWLQMQYFKWPLLVKRGSDWVETKSF